MQCLTLQSASLFGLSIFKRNFCPLQIFLHSPRLIKVLPVLHVPHSYCSFHFRPRFNIGWWSVPQSIACDVPPVPETGGRCKASHKVENILAAFFFCLAVGVGSNAGGMQTWQNKGRWCPLPFPSCHARQRFWHKTAGLALWSSFIITTWDRLPAI